jgi:pimeloyl-ACP methyl ester carboxylesterase
MSFIATSLPNSMAEIIPNAGHMIINTQPEACFNFINKVNKLDAQGELA